MTNVARLLTQQELMMAGTPKYKIFTGGGEYVASCKYAEDAAAQEYREGRRG
jgi:hypothetical protein